MTQTAAICKALLEGKTLSIMTAFQMFSCTNLPRELSRSVEQKFGVIVSKVSVKFTSKYGQGGHYFQYRLNKTEYNKPGIEKMREYLAEQMEGEYHRPEEQELKFVQPELF